MNETLKTSLKISYYGCDSMITCYLLKQCMKFHDLCVIYSTKIVTEHI